MSDCPHEWTATDSGWACTQCDTTTPGCQDCHRPLDTSLTICDPCLRSARRLLDQIRDYLAQIPDTTREIMGLRAIRYDLAGSSTADDSRLPFGLNIAYDDLTSGPNGIRTQAGALDLLHEWAEDWCRLTHDTDPYLDVITYLHDHTLWAAQNHPAWTDYLTDLIATRAVVRRLAGLAPETEPVPCVHCGGRIVHDWTPRGLDDTARCTRCGLTWDTKARLDYANLTHLRALPQTHPDILVTPEQARAIHPGLRAGTLRQWLHRRDIQPENTTPRGEPLIRLNAITRRLAGATA